MANVGYATLTILPSAKGFSSALGREINPTLASAGHTSGERSGKAFGGGFLPAMKGMLGPAVGLAAGLGIGQGIKSGLETASFLEQAKISFQTLLGPGGDVQGFIKNLTTFAANTPFELPGLTDNARALLGVGIAAKDVIPTMTALGDAAGALGLSQDGLNSVVRAYTQINSKGKVSAEEMLQMAEAGIPAWPLLARAMGKTVPEVQKLSQDGKLLAKDVLPALNKEMEKEYGGSMAKQAKTLAGVWSTVKDTINMAMAQALQPLVPILTTILPPAAALLAGAIGGISDAAVRLGTVAAPVFMPLVEAAKQAWAVLTSGGAPSGGLFALAGPLGSITPLLLAVRDAAMTIGGTFAQIGNSFMAYFGPIGAQLATSVLPPLLGLGRAISANVAPAFSIIADVVNGLFAAFAPLASIIATVILPALINLGTAIMTGVQPVLQVIGNIIRTSIIPAFQQMATQAGPLFTQLGQTINVVAAQIGPILQGVATVIQNVWGFIGPFVMSTLQGMFTNVIGIFSGIFTVIQGVVNLISALFRGDWAAAWAALGQIVSGAVQAVWNFVQLWIVGKITAILGPFFGFLRGAFAGAWGAVSGIVRGAATGISSIIGWLIMGVRGVITGGLNVVRGIFTSVFNGVLGFLRGVWSGIVNGVSGMIGNVIRFFGGLLGKITGAIGNAGSALWNVGRQIIQGLIDGIGSMMGAIGNAIISLVPGPIVGVFKSLLGIHSPSRVFRGFGVNIGEGLILGIQDMHGGVKKAVEKLAGIPAGASLSAPTVTAGGVTGAVSAALSNGTGAPVVGQLTLQSSGNVRDDVEEALFHIRRISRGGLYA
ncbi:tape measure protein [Arthrobacter phage Janeemi]|uniref:Tape measure protein n=1 Tax=Arthrobacter phage Janeemi TaxID=2927240 RepID=A0A9E7QIR1_9CAUD|nr:tape measure protein [Arthrobacter phage Janeemi]